MRIRVTDFDTGAVVAANTTLEECFPGDEQADEREAIADECTVDGSTVWGGGAAPALRIEVLPC